MEGLQQLLNFTNSDGEVILLFNKFTISQVVTFLIIAIVICLAIKLIKGVIKIAVIIGAVIVFLLQYNIASPTQLLDTASKIKETGVTAYESFASVSENIKIEGNAIKVCIEDNWFDISSISQIVSGKDGVLTVTIDDESYVVEDNAIIELLSKFK